MKKILLLLTIFLFISCSKKDEPILETFNYTYTDSEIDLFNRINHYRDSLGVGTVSLVEHVSYKCMEHNNYMITNNIVNHDYFYDRYTNIENVCEATKVAEIIAFNYQTNKSVLRAWINSSCHDTIIEGDFKRIGISIRENQVHRKYYTVIFID
jgi:uncharacterized protein YkwD